jgi:hypothetical protein
MYPFKQKFGKAAPENGVAIAFGTIAYLLTKALGIKLFL